MSNSPAEHFTPRGLVILSMLGFPCVTNFLSRCSNFLTLVFLYVARFYRLARILSTCSDFLTLLEFSPADISLRFSVLPRCSDLSRCSNFLTLIFPYVARFYRVSWILSLCSIFAMLLSSDHFVSQTHTTQYGMPPEHIRPCHTLQLITNYFTEPNSTWGCTFRLPNSSVS
jgi:hypothetical protein